MVITKKKRKQSRFERVEVFHGHSEDSVGEEHRNMNGAVSRWRAIYFIGNKVRKGH